MPSIYRQRQQKLIDSLPDKSLVMLSAAPVMYRSRDVAFPYRQDSDFYYLTGFGEPEAVAVWYKDGGNFFYWIFCRPYDPVIAQWDGEHIDPEAAKRDLEADDAYPIQQLPERIGPYLQKCRYFYSTSKFLAPEGLHIPIQKQDIQPHIAEMRVIKSSEEIALLQKAIDISIEAHIGAMRHVKPGMYEYEIEAILLETFYRRGSRFPAYGAIVGAGKNGCILHYKDNEKILESGELLLIDAGAEYACYAADITRTFPVSGKFQSHQRALYQVVLDAQLAGIAAIRPGAIYTDIQTAIISTLVDGLIDLDILQGDRDTIIEEKQYRSVYMHGSGHWLGMDVHDVGTYKNKDDSSRTLEAGMVLTVEPGVYISNALQNIAPQWHNIGIRIEDDILVTAEGACVLSAALPKTIDEMEQILGHE